MEMVLDEPSYKQFEEASSAENPEEQHRHRKQLTEVMRWLMAEVDRPPYRVARRLFGLIIGHWAIFDARFAIEAGLDIRDIAADRGINIVYMLLS